MACLHWGAAETEIKWLTSFSILWNNHHRKSRQQSRKRACVHVPVHSVLVTYHNVFCLSEQIKYLFSLLLNKFLKTCLHVSLCSHLLSQVLSRLQNKLWCGRAVHPFQVLTILRWSVNIWNSYLIEPEMKFKSNQTGLTLSMCWDYSLHCSTVVPEVCHCTWTSSYSKLNTLHKNYSESVPDPILLSVL